MAMSIAVLVSGCAVGAPQREPDPLPTVEIPEFDGTQLPSGAAMNTEAPDADPQQADVFSLKVGDCLNDTTGIFIEDVPLVDCAAEHDLEVFDEFSTSAGAFDPIALGDEADAGCTARFESFIGISYDASTLDVVSYKPTAESWMTGDRLISCMVEDPSVKTVGSLRGAAR